MSIDKTCIKIKKVINSIPQKKLLLQDELLSVHQAVDILWAAYRENEAQDERERKLANMFICAFLVAIKLKIKNLDHLIERRLKEIETAPYRGKKK